MPAALWLLLLLAPPVVIDGVDVTDWTPRQLWTKADEYFHDGHYEQAIRLQDRIIQLDPSDLEAYTVAAWLIWSLGREPEARRYLERCVAANPTAWASHHELGLHLFERLGLATEALPHLLRATTLPGAPDLVHRTLAHAYYFAEQPSLAVAVWERLRDTGRVPGTILMTNLPKALLLALRSDLQARYAGAISGPPPAALPTVVTDARPDRTHRVLDLREAGRTGGPADFRIVYRGRPVINKVAWQWQAMLSRKRPDGTFDETAAIIDEDGDGIAESLPPLAELRRIWRESGPAARRFVAPDRFEIGRDATGRPVPWRVTVTAAGLTVAPPVYVATDDLAPGLRLRLRDTRRRRDSGSVLAALPAGVYCANSASPDEGAPVALSLPAEQIPEGRQAVILELLVHGVVLDRKVLAGQVLYRGHGGVQLLTATPGEIEQADEPLRDRSESVQPRFRRPGSTKGS